MLYVADFWTDAAPPPAGARLELTGPVANLFPTRAAGCPGLVCLVTGDAARSLSALPQPQQRAAVLQQLADWFQAPEALQPAHMLLQDWCAAARNMRLSCCAWPGSPMLSALPQLQQRAAVLRQLAG